MKSYINGRVNRRASPSTSGYPRAAKTSDLRSLNSRVGFRPTPLTALSSGIEIGIPTGTETAKDTRRQPLALDFAPLLS